jgi:hypothetical protein
MVAYPRSFAGQFVIGSAEAVPARADGVVHRLNELSIVTLGDLPVAPVRDAKGRLIGAFLGYPLDDRQGCMLGETVVLEREHPGPEGLDAFIEDAVYRYAGSYVFVLDDTEERRVYLDAGSSLSAVFAADRLLCASTTGLLLDAGEYAQRFDEELYDHLRVRDAGWFLAGLTAHHGITRLLGNHYLDLRDGVQRRHWPSAPLAAAEDPDEACATINAVVARTVATLQTAGPVATTLTAGSETRLVLGACRALKDSLRLFTLAGIHESELDAYRAGELARTFGLRHALLPIRFADDDGTAQWLARSSHCIGGPNSRTYPSVEPMAEYAFFTGGVGGEAGRGFFWRSTDTPDLKLDARGLAARTGMPVHPDVVAAVERWLQGLPELDVYHVLDLAFIELRLGCWGFSQAYASPEVREIQPLISRESFVAMLSLPPDWRRSNRMVTRCIELAWPELLEQPFNAYGDHRDRVRTLQRAVRNPRLILRKLRKRFG